MPKKKRSAATKVSFRKKGHDKRKQVPSRGKRNVKRTRSAPAKNRKRSVRANTRHKQSPTTARLRAEIQRLRKERARLVKDRRRIEAQSRGLFIKLANARASREREAAVLIQEEREKAKRKQEREKTRRDSALNESQVVSAILQRDENETASEWIERVEKEMGRLGFHRDAWYNKGAELFDMTERDFYTLIVSPKLGSELS